MKKTIAVLLFLSLLLLLVTTVPMMNKAMTIMNQQPLSSYTIVIDAGHGGHDPGARASDTDEDELNLLVAIKLQSILENAGASVKMVRTDDSDLSDDSSTSHKRSDLKNRLRIINEPEVLLFVSIHMNTNGSNLTHGSEVYYQKNSLFSKQLAECIQQKLRAVTSSKFPVKPGDYYLLNNSTTLGVIVECGFLTNATDFANLKKEKYQEEIAFGIYEGIRQFIQILQ